MAIDLNNQMVIADNNRTGVGNDRTNTRGKHQEINPMNNEPVFLGNIVSIFQK